MAITVKVYNMNGEETGTIELNDDIFGVEINEHCLHMSIVQYLANKRQGTQSAKTRAEVSGGGRKPWRQKGTGKARQGSIRSPQWKGGGVVFAPKPRDYSFKLNKKVKRIAMQSAFSAKAKEDQIIVLDEIKLDGIKTKNVAQMLKNLKIEKSLIVIKDGDKNLQLSARNIPDIKTASVNTLNTYDIIKYEKFVITKDAIEKLEEVYA